MFDRVQHQAPWCNDFSPCLKSQQTGNLTSHTNKESAVGDCIGAATASKGNGESAEVWAIVSVTVLGVGECQCTVGGGKGHAFILSPRDKRQSESRILTLAAL